MRGEVEVYRTIKNGKPELIAKESNLLVDGASKNIVDMLTTTPSLSGVESASALLDTSNYMVQAISFGKPWELFSSGSEYISGHFGGSADARPGRNMWFKTAGANPLLSEVIGVSVAHDRDSNISSLTWQHLQNTPEGVSPTDTRLQENSTSAYLQTELIPYLNSYLTLTSSAFSNISSTLESGFDNGQNLNLLAISGAGSTYFQDIIDNCNQASTLGGALVDFNLSGLDQPQNLMGCYPPSDGINLYLFDRAFSIGALQKYTEDITTSSNFNWQGKESMDASGWVNLVNPEGIGTVGDPDNGLIVSANPDGSFSSTGEIVYKVTVSGGDAACASMFGGIWYMGLWTFDNPQILGNGVTPPYSWNNISNPRRYRLFSKKAFTKDITYHVDNGTTAGLKDLADNGKLDIIWRIYI
jgi:hypothetical protein